MRQPQIFHQQVVAQVLRKYAGNLTIFLELLPQNTFSIPMYYTKVVAECDLKAVGYISSILFRDKTDGTQHCTKNKVFH